MSQMPAGSETPWSVTAATSAAAAAVTAAAFAVTSGEAVFSASAAAAAAVAPAPAAAAEGAAYALVGQPHTIGKVTKGHVRLLPAAPTKAEQLGDQGALPSAVTLTEWCPHPDTARLARLPFRLASC
eukprot:TRINITY_DN5370_c0_g2_i1.p3 TRINITY_DN5370_c0_g2~~TRINITY_DN5370_c0_g2_i1.p3  ORF type:complete len:127 (+),score=30.79 TRINITY_DN5370_c0_g2_i1:664-1044(+)